MRLNGEFIFRELPYRIRWVASMVQKARPVSDASTGNWVVTPLYEKIDEPTPSDADFVSSD